MNANELELIANANRYTMGKALRDRLLVLINNPKNKNLTDIEKIILALNFAHSVTKCGMRGTK